MDPVAGRAVRTDRLQRLNEPQPVRVTVGERGLPEAVLLGAGRRTVAQVRDLWRIDDRWWCEAEVSRMYYEVELDNGTVVTLYRDRIAGGWYQQRYG